jgi:hypothetical protein
MSIVPFLIGTRGKWPETLMRFGWQSEMCSSPVTFNLDHLIEGGTSKSTEGASHAPWHSIL